MGARFQTQPHEFIDEDWKENAPCKGYTQLFFPAKTRVRSVGVKKITKTVKKMFCDGCPVRKECLAYGRKTGSWGVFGGEYMENGRVKCG